MNTPRSLPLNPAGRAARRGQLAVLGRRYSYTPARGPGESGTHWELVEITNITRGGEVTAYRQLAWCAGQPVGPVTRIAVTWGAVAVVDASRLDRDRAVKIARAHTYPGGDPRPWASLEEAAAALRPAATPPGHAGPPEPPATATP